MLETGVIIGEREGPSWRHILQTGEDTGTARIARSALPNFRQANE